jgi:outer membrane protein
MKRLPFFALLLVLSSVIAAAGQTAPAQTPAAQKPAVSKTAASEPAFPAGPAKVAVISFQAAVSQTNEFQRDFADLQKKYDPRRAQLKTLSDEIDALNKQLQAQDAQTSDAERVNRARTLDEKKKELDRDTQDAQSDFQNDMQQIIDRVAGKVGEVMTDYAVKQGYTLVLDASEQQQQSSIVIYVEPTTDITKAVIDAYNLKSGIPAPPAGAVGGGQPAVDAPQPQPAPSH